MEVNMTKEDIQKYSNIVNEVYRMTQFKGYEFYDLRAYNLLEYVGKELGVIDKISQFLPTEEDIQCNMERENNYYDSFSDYDFDKLIEEKSKAKQYIKDFKNLSIDDDEDEKLTEVELGCVDDVREIFYDVLGTDIIKKNTNKKKVKTRE